MKIKEKIDVLKRLHFRDWLEERNKVENELSGAQKMFCVCGRLATGLHESSCKRFNDKVNAETAKRLSHLIMMINTK